jgi:hypothetical protein
MNDTPDWIRRKQIEIFLAKPEPERWALGFGMIDEVQQMVRNAIRQQHPTWSEIEISVAVFKRYYQNDFSPLLLERIATQMRTFLSAQQRKLAA